jgi:hypothetical protein
MLLRKFTDASCKQIYKFHRTTGKVTTFKSLHPLSSYNETSIRNQNSGTCVTYNLVQWQAFAISKAVPCSYNTRLLFRKKMSDKIHLKERNIRLQLYNNINIHFHKQILYDSTEEMIENAEKWQLKKYAKKKKRMTVLRMISRKVLSVREQLGPNLRKMLISGQKWNKNMQRLLGRETKIKQNSRVRVHEWNISSDRSLSAKLMPTVADRGCHVVSMTDHIR